MVISSLGVYNMESGEVATHLRMCARELLPLTWTLIYYLGAPALWFLSLLRLMSFVFVVSPFFVAPALRYIFSSTIRRGLRYGSSVRQGLDVYLPLASDGEPQPKTARAPVVVFVSGGAWIIGYRMWGFLLGLALQRRGIVCISVDYRNFPQAAMPQMVDDVTAACEWVRQHVASVGGDPSNVTVVGQSAGAHLTALMLLRRLNLPAARDVGAHRIGTSAPAAPAAVAAVAAAPLPPTVPRFPARWVGISGPYDIERLAPEMTKRGLHPSIVEYLASGDLESISPTLLLARVQRTGSSRRRRSRSPAHNAQKPKTSQATAHAAAAHATYAAHAPGLLLPPMALFHGTADSTVDWRQSQSFGAVLREVGAHVVRERYFRGKSHTDPILEDPLGGGIDAADPLLEEVLRLVRGEQPPPLSAEEEEALVEEEQQRGAFHPPLVRRLIVQLARKVNPF